MNREVTWDLIPCPILPPSLISHTVSMDVVKHHGRRKKLQLANQLAFSSHSPLDGEKGEKEVWRWGEREIIYLSLRAVPTGMTSTLRSAAMRAILMFVNCEGQSHKTVSTDHNF